MSAKSAVLLVGSAKQPHSTSERLAEHMAQRLRAQGVATDIVLIYRMISSEARRRELVATINAADVVVLAFPLFVDSLPFIVVKTLEMLAASRIGDPSPKAQTLMAVVNCGFPEARQNDLAIAICRRFAKESGFQWAGGMGLGAGETINGKPLAECGRLVRNVTAALDLAADALAAGKPVPEQAIALMARPLVPNFLYRIVGELGWHWKSHRHGVRKQLKARPYAR
jgi:hypothetical protein